MVNEWKRETVDLEHVHEKEEIKGEASGIRQTNEGVGETIKNLIC